MSFGSICRMLDPQDCARFAGVRRPVTVIDAGIPTMTAAADNVERIEAPEPRIRQVEFQASRYAPLPRPLWHDHLLPGNRNSGRRVCRGATCEQPDGPIGIAASAIVGGGQVLASAAW